MRRPQCPGSNMLLSAPKGTTELRCPNCGERVPVEELDPVLFKYAGQPHYRVRGHCG